MEREEAVKIIRKNWPDASFTQLREALETLIPKLKESEDEKVRKKVIEVLKLNIKEAESQMQASRGINRTFEVYACNKVIAYLEKKSLNISAASEWLRKHVCNYINSEYNEFHQCVEYDGSIDKERLINDFEEAMPKEQKPLSTKETELNSIAFLEQMGYTCIPPGAKPAEWSAADEEMLDAMIDMVSNSLYEPLCPREGMLDWLLSLRPRWKPSEEQMNRLSSIIAALRKDYCDDMADFLASIHRNLKKLI